MLTDLRMLDELAVRLKVQGGMRWSSGTVTRLGRTRSVIGSLGTRYCSMQRLYQLLFIIIVILPSIVIRGNRTMLELGLMFRANQMVEKCRLSCSCGFKSGATMKP